MVTSNGTVLALHVVVHDEEDGTSIAWIPELGDLKVEGSSRADAMVNLFLAYSLEGALDSRKAALNGEVGVHPSLPMFDVAPSKSS